MALGLVLLVNGGVGGGIWFTFLGWFILTAADAEATGSITASRLEGATAASAMTIHPITVPAQTTVRQLLDGWLFRERCSTFPVIGEHGDVVGLVTNRRIRAVPTDAWDRTLVAGVAAPLAEVVTCQVDDELAHVLTRMNASSDQRALVFRENHLVGVISPSDVARVLDRAELRGPVHA
jgi:CBS domain-containing protein